jgi:pimeloyl-ACP methyl ester carboxylesterase
MSPRSPHAAVLAAAMTIAAVASGEEFALPDPAALAASAALPDALVSFSGERITTREAWLEKRAPELRRLVQNYEYGYLPPPAKVEAKVEREDRAALGGKATLREITLSLARPEGAKMHLLIVVPNQRTKPAPVFLGLNVNGNLALLPDPLIAVPPGWKSNKKLTVEESRGSEVDTWSIEQSIDRGYAVASFWNGDVVPDDKEAAEAVLRQMRAPGADERGPADTATIAMWAWCFHRAVDYLVTDSALDAKRIAVVGHSRNGKTALLAAAFDERVALAIPSQAGCGGTAPCRVAPELSNEGPTGRSVVETVRRINTSFPHWFCGNFKAFNEGREKLPFDQHALIALCAPRPVLVSNATEDLWANPSGQFEMLRAADPVYRLVAGDGLGAQQMPEVGKLLPSRLGYFIRPGKHSMTREDWAAWLDYADRWLR